jgi:U3 small nucleolar RNA-associated protein 10
MASSLAAQLSQIAANSTKSLNVKAQKAAHGQSLIFEPRVAASQSFDNIYILCHEGFEELCLLDGRFLDFQQDVFSEQSQEEDRTQMTEAQNAELDTRLEAFLGLVGGFLRLSPSVKAVEWLIRRFRSDILLKKYEIKRLIVFTEFMNTIPLSF